MVLHILSRKYNSNFIDYNPIEILLREGKEIAAYQNCNLASEEMAMIVKSYAKKYFNENVGVYFSKDPLNPLFSANNCDITRRYSDGIVIKSTVLDICIPAIAALTKEEIAQFFSGPEDPRLNDL